MLLAFVLGVSVLSVSSGLEHVTISLWSCMFLVSLLLTYGMGIMDDLIGLDAKIKFTIQILASLLMPMVGLYINNLYGLFGIYEIPYYIGIPLTIITIVFICNAINLIDGIDGLSTSICIIALGGFLWIFTQEGLYIYSIMIAGLMGTLIPFGYYNFFGRVDKQQKIFMGDSGSLTLGFILGFLFVKNAMHNPEVTYFRPNSLLQSITLLIVPCFDVVRITLARMLHHRSLFDADKNHIHHKLLRAGLSEHNALFTIISLAAAYIVINHLLCDSLPITIILVVDIAIFALFHYILNQFIRHAKKQPFE